MAAKRQAKTDKSTRVEDFLTSYFAAEPIQANYFRGADSLELVNGNGVVLRISAAEGPPPEQDSPQLVFELVEVIEKMVRDERIKRLK